MSEITKYGVEAASNAEDIETWFWDALLDLNDNARKIVAEHMARLKGK